MCNSVNGATATATTAAALGSATAGNDATSVAGASGGGGASATTFDSAGVQQLMTSLDQVLRQLQATVAGMATASAGGGDVAAATGGGSVTQGAMSCSMTAPSKLPELPAQLPPTKTAPPETPPTKAGGPEQAAPPTHKPAPAQTYVVARGDTLTKIARRFNVDTAALYDANKDVIGADPNRINPGMKLTIPAGAPPFAERAPAPKGKGTGRAGATGGGSAGGAPASTVPAPGKDGKVVQSEVAYGAGRTRINYTDGTALVYGKVGPRGEDGFYTIDAQGHKGVTGI